MATGAYNALDDSTTTFGDIVPKIEASKEWNILVYGINEPDLPETNAAHRHLLSGILGTNISVEKISIPSFYHMKNGVTVKIYNGSHPECNVSHDEIDLLLYFIPVNVDMIENTHVVKIGEITKIHGAKIWKHAVIAFTHIDATVEEFAQRSGDITVRLEGVLDSWTRIVQSNLTRAIENESSVSANESSVSANEVLIQLAGKQEIIDLPRPHEKWLSHLWIGCFLSTKVHSMPAILKISQHRVVNSLDNRDTEKLPLFEQPIQVKENSIQLPKNVRIGLGFGGSGAIAGAAAAGATVGGLIGALALGIPSFGVAAGTGLALGAVIGGGMGVGVAGAVVGGSYKAAKDKQFVEIDETDLKLYYGEILSRIPKISSYLKESAEKQANCRIVVAGIRSEGVTTVSAAIAQKKPLKSDRYLHQVSSRKANILVFDYPGFPKLGDKQLKARELIQFQLKKSTHLLVFCIPMNSSKEDLVYSPHVRYLERLCEVDQNILRHTVIVLTHANELRAQNDSSLIESFSSEVRNWKQQMTTVLKRYINIDSDIAENIPIVPVGNDEKAVIDLSDNESDSPATQCHWLSEFLIQAMRVTKAEGMPALIECNQQRIQNGECPNPEDAQECITKAKCLMYSQTGLQEKKQAGEAIGMILGVRES